MAVTQEYRCLHAVSKYNRPARRIHVNLTIGLFATPFGGFAVALSLIFRVKSIHNEALVTGRRRSSTWLDEMLVLEL